MTTNDDLNRRQTDRRLETMEVALAEALEDIKASFVKHRRDDHVGLTKTEVEDRLSRQDELDTMTERMATVIEGTPILDVRGNVVGHEDGLMSIATQNRTDLKEILHRTNGGVEVTYKPRIRKIRDWTVMERIAATGIGVTLMLAMLPNIARSIEYVAEWITTL